MTALKAFWRAGYSYKKAGLMLLDLVPASRVQSDLWTAPDTPRAIELMKAIDGRHYGRETIACALFSAFVSLNYCKFGEKTVSALAR